MNKHLGIRQLLVLSLVLSFGCSAKILKYEKASDLKKNDEFSKQVKIEEPAADVDEEPTKEKAKPVDTRGSSMAPPAPIKEVKIEQSKTKVTEKDKGPKEKEQKDTTASKKVKGKKAKKTAEQAPAVKTHEPSLEDPDGFEARRPIKDPFRVGEKTVHRVYYDASIFDFSAGTLTMKVNPFAQVNERKAYSFDINIKSSSFFSSYYSVDDRVRAYMDFEDLIPTTFALHVKETKQLREGQMFFDFTKNEATYWEKKYTEKDGQEEKKKNWEILPFSQNVFSAVYYMRTFQWEDGKEYAFRVADDGENVVFKGKVVARETLKTDVGTFKAIKIKPEFTAKGVFKPVGDIFIWLSDDEHKYILRIESKIKIGSLVSEISELVPGDPEQK